MRSAHAVILAKFAKMDYIISMTTMNISLPDTLKHFVDHRVEAEGYSSSSEYVRDLIRQDQLREAERQLTDLIRSGIESGPSRPVDKTFWASRRANIAK